MNVTEAVKARRSIRGFKPDPVSDDKLREILEVARFAPSNCNTQPWHLTVVSGEARHKLQEAIFAEINAGKPLTRRLPPAIKALQMCIKTGNFNVPWITTG